MLLRSFLCAAERDIMQARAAFSGVICQGEIMSDSKTMEVFKGVRDAQQKLDYFLLGLSTALFAYIGGEYEPQAISLSENSFELAAIVLIFVSIISGFIRINNHITIMKLNHQTLDMSDTRETIMEAYSVQIGRAHV